MELTLIDKKISQGRAKDYYLIFDSRYGKLKNKVTQENYGTFSIGEKFQVLVYKGYFDGYFFAEPLKCTRD